MAHSNQAKKRVRQNETARQRNKTTKSAMRTAIKRTLELCEAGKQDDAQAALTLAMKRIDKAAKTNTIHKNAANRQKSRLTRRVAAIS